MKSDVKVNLTGAIKKTRTLKALPKATKYQLTSWGGQFLKYLKQVAIKGRYVGKYKGGRRRTSELSRGIRQRVFIHGNVYRLEVGTTGVKYAWILEKGGTITPKRKQWLTVPIGRTQGWARNYPGAFIIKSKKGNLLIVEKAGKNKLKPLFVLKKSVRIPAFHWLERSLKDRKGKLDNMLSKPRLYQVAQRMAR